MFIGPAAKHLARTVARSKQSKQQQEQKGFNLEMEFPTSDPVCLNACTTLLELSTRSKTDRRKGGAKKQPAVAHISKHH